MFRFRSCSPRCFSLLLLSLVLPMTPQLVGAGNPAIDGTWSQATLAVSPTKALGRSLLYDSKRHRAIIFGGFDFNDTWVLDLNNPSSWELLPVRGALPVPRGQADVVYDPVNDRLWVFGGRSGSGAVFGDPAYLQFTDAPGESATWVSVNAEPDPATGNRASPRYGSGTTYDPAHQAMVIFGGGYGTIYSAAGTWSLSLDAVPTWHLLPPTCPFYSGSVFANMFIDPVRNRLVFQGSAAWSGYWQFPWVTPVHSSYTAASDFSSGWTLLSSAEPESTQAYGDQSCYHPLQDRIITMTDSYMGFASWGPWPNCPYSEGVHEFRFSDLSWHRLYPGNGPGPLSVDDIIYDPDHDRMVVITGNVSGSFMETWFLSWTGLSGVEDGTAPRSAMLVAGAPRPNPSSGRVIVPIALREASSVGALVLDAQGRRVRDLGSHAASGSFELAWDGLNDRGVTAGSGVFFVRISTLDGRATAVVRVVRTE